MMSFAHVKNSTVMDIKTNIVILKHNFSKKVKN